MFTPLELTLLLLGSAVLGVVAFRMMHLPPMLGYLAVGILLGPHAMGLAEQSHATELLGEFGVVFLMFSIGLEFSLAKLMAMRSIVFGLGMAQVGLTIAATMLFGWLIHFLLPPSVQLGWQASFALGGALAMSSTAIVVKLLTERLELESLHGGAGDGGRRGPADAPGGHHDVDLVMEKSPTLAAELLRKGAELVLLQKQLNVKIDEVERLMRKLEQVLADERRDIGSGG